jgi:hypothetical protein
MQINWNYVAIYTLIIALIVIMAVMAFRTPEALKAAKKFCLGESCIDKSAIDGLNASLADRNSGKVCAGGNCASMQDLLNTIQGANKVNVVDVRGKIHDGVDAGLPMGYAARGRGVYYEFNNFQLPDGKSNAKGGITPKDSTGGWVLVQTIVPYAVSQGANNAADVYQYIYMTNGQVYFRNGWAQPCWGECKADGSNKTNVWNPVYKLPAVSPAL